MCLSAKQIRRWCADARAHGRTPNMAYLRGRHERQRAQQERPWREDFETAAAMFHRLYGYGAGMTVKPDPASYVSIQV